MSTVLLSCFALARIQRSMAGFRDLLVVASPPLSKHFRSMPSLNLEPLNVMADTGKPVAREKVGFLPMRGFPVKSRRRASPRRNTLLSRPQITRSSHEERGMLTSGATKLRPTFENFPRTSDPSKRRAMSNRSKEWIRYQHVDDKRAFEKKTSPRLQRGRGTQTMTNLATTRPGDLGLWRQEPMDSREKCVKWLLGLPDNPEPYEPQRAGTLPRRWAI